ncbi:hypothetical protein RM549_13610 [Salegentibacter sp. F188]|uniref:PKD/Chitinase domain-containing protein n=1 Tax=Autumnicola patrickiae TaxID=3075591 RepID=A0ABU3E4B4_9FLAO|nr:hypothetical protein [Salegentibacter sp. F188]MDT0690829.1 hypothetical protein [Salegentibacter sp. F188]
MKKHLKIILSLVLSAALFSCSEDDDAMVDLSTLEAPSNLGATFEITQDNSGLVTIIPTGEGAVLYTVDFGDGSPASEELKVGQQVEHVYEEGQYEVGITGQNLNGETAQGTQSLTVSFLAPENLETTITKDPNDNYTVTVSATAENAAMYQVFFGENEDEEPVPLMEGETVSYTYNNIGTYNVRVVALSGGAATTEVNEEVTITDPLFLPIDFESETLDYTFSNFGGGEGAGVPIVENPDPSEVNSSELVASYTKPENSETWAGTSIPLGEPIDFSSRRYISVDVWSPIEGADVLFKIENIDNADINVEVRATTTVSNEWETLTFDLTSIDPAQEYSNLVLFFNMDVAGTGETYYFDNIRQTTLVQFKLPITFDNPNLAYNFGVFNGTSFEVVENPDQSGVNTSSSQVGAITNSGNNWEGGAFNLDVPVDFSGEDKTITMKLWSDVAVPVLLKFENGVNGERQNEVTANHSGSGWEELSFNFAADAVTSYVDGASDNGQAFVPTGHYSTMVMFIDGPGNTAGTFYIDDISLGGVQVISLFSDLGDDVPLATWRTDWSATDYEEVEFEGELRKLYSNFDFVGIETGENQIDASEMTHFHTEIWTDNATVFRIKLVDFGPNGIYQGGDDTEHEIVIENPAQGEWVSLDIPLSDFTNLTSKANIAQFIYSAAPSGEATVYIDNVYFHN